MFKIHRMGLKLCCSVSVILSLERDSSQLQQSGSAFVAKGDSFSSCDRLFWYQSVNILFRYWYLLLLYGLVCSFYAGHGETSADVAILKCMWGIPPFEHYFCLGQAFWFVAVPLVIKLPLLM